MLKKVIATINENKMLNKSDHIIIGLSGGADSTALLYALNEIKEEYQLNITAVHINHGYREEAMKDEEFSKSICEKLNVGFKAYRFDMVKYAKEKGISLEEAGREYRYSKFREVLDIENAQKIAVAHNLDDQAETIFMRFFRGTGLKGLRGIPKVRGEIIRPLIDCKREDIEMYLNHHGLAYITDETNSQDTFTRNKIRLNLLPIVKNEINPNILETMKRMAEVVKIEDNYIEDIAKKEFKKTTLIENKKVRIKKKEFNKLDEAIKLRIARLAVEKINDSIKDFDFAHAKTITNVPNYKTGKEFNIFGDIIVQNSYEDIILYKKDNKTSVNIDLKDGDFFYLEEMDEYISVNYFLPADKENYIKTYTKVFDYGKIIGSLTLRNRLKGDRIFIENIAGSKKIKDYFIDNKIERAKRDEIALIAVGSTVLWILDDKNITDNRYLTTERENGIHIERWRKRNE